MAVFCEIKDVVDQIRYKTQLFYEAMKRDSIADQLYNFSNDDSSNDQSIPYSKSLDRDYSSLMYVANKNTSPNPPPTVNISPPPPNGTTSSGGTAAINKSTSAPALQQQQQQTNNTTNNTNTTNQTTNEQPQATKCKIVTFSASQASKPSNTLKSVGLKSTTTITSNGINITNPTINTTTNHTNHTTTTTTTTTTAPTATTNNNTTPNNSATPASNSTTNNSSGPVFIFSKQSFKSPNSSSSNTSQDSLLTKLVRPNDSEKDLFSEYGEIIPPPGMGMLLQVHIVGVGLLKVRVIDKATVVQSIVATLKTYFQQATSASTASTNQPHIYPDPRAYFLRIADEDGRVDEDYPTLDPNQMIYKFKDETFILCLDRKYESDRAKRASWGSNGSRSNNGLSSSGAGLAPPSEKGHHRKVSCGTNTNESMLVVKITLPDSSITKVAFQPDMKLKELLINTCKKRKLNIAEHIFQLENGTPVNLTMTMEQLGSLDIVLVSTLRRSMSADGSMLSSDESDDQQDIFWHDALAWQYKQFEVVKLKKYGSKQERIIGIDKERITNMSPNPKKEQETKRPTRLIKDVSRVALADKPKHFMIEYTDGKSYIYETKTHTLAVEVVGKVQYLLKHR